jgi:hypothetical protein
MADYRQAIAEAKARREPPYEPPDDFLPEQKCLAHLRLLNWRDRYRFAELHECWDWLAEMAGRWHDGVPAVALSEFAALAAWLEGCYDHVRALTGGAELIELGGRKLGPANLRYGAGQGAKVHGAGLLAQDLRALKARLEGVR